MEQRLRKTGIDLIGDVPWGTHFCQFYQTKKDLVDILVPYFKAGLENNEFCMWVTSQPLSELEAKKALRKAVPDIDHYLEKGQIEIIPYTDWYVIGGSFDSQRVLNGWIEKHDRALAAGYDGLRLTGNTFWLEKEDWKDFVSYEEEIDSVIGTYRMIAMCTYSLEKCRAAEVIDVVNNHEFALTKREGKWELVESLKRKSALEAHRKSEARFKLLSETAGQLLEVEDPQPVVNELCTRVMEHLDCHAFFNFLADEATGRLRLNTCAGIPADEVRKIEWLDYGVAVCGCAAREGCRIVAEDIANTQDPRTDLVKSYGIQAYCCHPLFTQGQVIGTLSFGTKNRPRFTADEIAVMKTVADQVAIAIQRLQARESLQKALDEHKRREEELKKLNRTLKALSDSSQAMMRATDESWFLQEICKIIEGDCGYSMVWIGYAEEDEKKTIRPIAYAGFDEGYIQRLNLTWADAERGRGPTGTAIRTGKVAGCRNMLTDPLFAPWREEALKRGYASSLALPLMAGDKRLGAITIYAREPDAFLEDEIALLSELAGDLAYGISAVRLSVAHAHAVESLRKSEQQYSSLFNAMTEGFALHEIICDTRGKPCDYRFLGINPAFERLTGLKRGEVVGRTVKEVLPDNDPYWVEMYGKVALTGESVHFDHYSLALSRHYEVFAYSPAPREFAVVFRDITQRKQAEDELLKYRNHLEELVRERTVELETRNKELEGEIAERKRAEQEKKSLENQLAQVQKIEALGRFAGGIAHDLNNILYPIIINTEMLLEETVQDTSFHQTLKEVLNAAYRQRDLVKQILSFSRRSEQQFNPIHIKPLVKETLTLLRSSLPSTIEIRQHIDADTDSILGDPTQIQQIIMNLCRNAADALISLTGTIEVGLVNTLIESSSEHPEIKSGEYLQLMVKDTGSGMTPKVMDHIFEPFFTTKEVGKGSGMGLAVVHGIVKDHGGSITVESEPGKGSQFTVYLPITDERSHAQRRDSEKAGSIGGKGRVLLIDDEEIILSSLKKALNRLGYTVFAVKDGREAFDMFCKTPDAFDLAITDLTMPGMTGVELSTKIMEIRPDIPVILCTGFSDVINEQEAKTMGIRELLVKPASISELKTTINRVLRSEKMQR